MPATTRCGASSQSSSQPSLEFDGASGLVVEAPTVAEQRKQQLPPVVCPQPASQRPGRSRLTQQVPPRFRHLHQPRVRCPREVELAIAEYRTEHPRHIVGKRALHERLFDPGESPDRRRKPGIFPFEAGEMRPGCVERRGKVATAELIEPGEQPRRRTAGTAAVDEEGQHVGATRQRRRGFKRLFPLHRGQRLQQREQRLLAERHALRHESRKTCTAQPVFQERKHVGVGDADRKETLGRSVAPRTVDHPPCLRRRIRTEMHVLFEAAQFQLAPGPCFNARTPPGVKHGLAARRAKNDQVHGNRAGARFQHLHGQRQRIRHGKNGDAADPGRDARPGHRLPRNILDIGPARRRQLLRIPALEFGRFAASEPPLRNHRRRAGRRRPVSIRPRPARL